MIVVRRNGQTHVYKGWRAWLVVGLSLLLFWLVMVVAAFAIVGAALTIGLILMLLVPAAALAMIVRSMARRP